MHARSALFDLYGDHLEARDGQAPVASLVRLLDAVGIAAPAVRTAISRMVAQGWLEPATIGGARGYYATEQATSHLADAADRVYRRTARPWDGSWQLVLVEVPSGRATRSRLNADLTFLGYAELTDRVWVSPFPRSQLSSVLTRAGATARTARALDVDPPPISAWDLDALRAAYDEWLGSAPDLLRRHLAAHADPEEAAFAARFHLVHGWRKFLFADPGLPDELLAHDWPGRSAAEVFAREAERLKPASDRFVVRCLDG
ncbi:phenylacetic acid degradation operon negative regulatory protein [Nocardioides psychrotolerans]|uniref:Transcriptional regulator, PaaX family n=1 Tax=Nocardioides psychrotolerans TaxID=1005945 RepID=A0A1I3MIA9_9ACTN|nr:PaaX family transcriptional regulator C-terminal domain-containing protein [Nocardioides psychrotolerans]GEP39513.1 phenylacetic acid degradation operon negative regulatory protein [Nocardioides psychrotolerans]SFI96757.1 transcriptional regulator, PaaX family [Nocardioides psychrotolerans]